VKTVTVKEWVEALRSGEYNQITGRLRSQQDGFCCLGLLCDLGDAPWEGDGTLHFTVRDTRWGATEESGSLLAGITLESLLASVRKAPVRSTLTFDHGRYKFELTGSNLMVWGWDGDWFLFQDSDLATVLAELNDSSFSFRDIADVIENVCRPSAKIAIDAQPIEPLDNDDEP
jgi:hypothetical protein